MIKNSPQTQEELKEHSFTYSLAVDGHHGIYTWQCFAQRFPYGWGDCLEDTRAVLLAGPEHEEFWECVNEAEQDWSFENYTVCQEQDGDIFLIKEMSQDSCNGCEGTEAETEDGFCADCQSDVDNDLRDSETGDLNEAGEAHYS